MPDAVIRFGIQRELEMELTKINKLTVEEKAEKNRLFVEELKKLPIAIQQDKGQYPLWNSPDAEIIKCVTSQQTPELVVPNPN